MDSLHEPYRLSSLVNRVFVPSRIASSSGVVTSAEGLTYGRNRSDISTIARFAQGVLTTKIEGDVIVSPSQVGVKREFSHAAAY